MQDRELVAAIVTGDPDGLAEAYDRYAPPLYTYCRFMLPDPHPPGESADVVADTFIIAAAKLQGLRDPDQLGSWLHAVARNECLRQLGSAGFAAGAARSVPGGALAEVSPPNGLRERVLKAGADNTPTGRAHRVSVTHGAGPFGRTGFPKPVVPSGRRWWYEVRRHPRMAAGVTAVGVAVMAAGITALLVAGGTHQAHASTVALGDGKFGTPSAPGGRFSPGRKPAPASGVPSKATSPADRPAAGQSTSPATQRSSAPTRSSPSPSPSTSPSPSPSPSPSSSPPPTPGTLRATPNKLVLSAVKGKAASGKFILTAVGGPVGFVIHSPNSKVTVSPSSGSLGVAGSTVTVTVTVRSLVALDVHLTVTPGNLIVTVLFSIKA
jgi:hypothetical protein